MFYPSIILSKSVHLIGYSTSPQSFLANPVRLIYYFSPTRHFSEIGSSGVLKFTPPSFLANPAHLVYDVLPNRPFYRTRPTRYTFFTHSIIFSEIGPVDLFVSPQPFLANPVLPMYCVSPSIIFSEPGSSDLLRFDNQSFLAKSARPIYYVSPSVIFSAPGSSDLLCSTHQSFLANPAHLSLHVSPSTIFSEIGPPDLQFPPQPFKKSVRLIYYVSPPVWSMDATTWGRAGGD